MTEEFLTRRQLRERELAAQSQNPNPDDSIELRDRELAIQEILRAAQISSVQAVQIPEPAHLAAAPVPEPVVAFDAQTAIEDFEIQRETAAADASAAITETNAQAVATQSGTQEPTATSVFTDDANPGTIPTQIITREVSTDTATIILPTIPNLNDNVISVPNSNIVIKTGAIDVVKTEDSQTDEVRPITGPIQVIVEAQKADDGLRAESLMQGITSIEPIPARRLREKSKTRVFPSKLRKGMGSLYMVLASALIMITVGVGVLAAYLLGYFN